MCDFPCSLAEPMLGAAPLQGDSRPVTVTIRIDAIDADAACRVLRLNAKALAEVIRGLRR